MVDAIDYGPMTGDAYLSEDQRYRYWLTRVWDPYKPKLPWVMLNPSTADARTDDPTIRRCIHYSKRDGIYGGLIVVNLFAIRAAKPRIAFEALDPVGPENEVWVDRVLAEAGIDGVPVICAWGSQFEASPRAARLLIRARFFGAELHCLDKSRTGHPRHPLYLPNTQPFQRWS